MSVKSDKNEFPSHQSDYKKKIIFEDAGRKLPSDKTAYFINNWNAVQSIPFFKQTHKRRSF
jgi:hypothetical protein